MKENVEINSNGADQKHPTEFMLRKYTANVHNAVSGLHSNIFSKEKQL